MAGGLDPHERGFRHLAGEAFCVVDGLEFVVLAPNEKFLDPRVAHRGHQLHRVAVFRSAGEREPGPRDTRLSPRIEILRDLGFACGTSNGLRHRYSASRQDVFRRCGRGHGRVPEAGHARDGSAMKGRTWTRAFTSAKRGIVHRPADEEVRCATPPPMSWPTTMTGPSCFSARRKRTSQADRRGIDASCTVSSPPERRRSRESRAATGTQLLGGGDAPVEHEACQTRLQEVSAVKEEHQTTSPFRPRDSLSGRRRRGWPLAWSSDDPLHMPGRLAEAGTASQRRTACSSLVNTSSYPSATQLSGST